MTTEGSRTDDASETSAAHCPAELRRRWRTMKGNTTQLLALAFAGIMLLPFSIGGVFGAYLAGGFVAGSETEPLIEWARVAFVYGWIFVVGFGGYRAYAVALRPDNLDGLLTAVSHRDLISGLLLTELALWSAFFLTVGSAASVAFAVGAGSLLTIPALLLTLCLLLATGIPAGFIIALGVRNAGVRSRLLSRLRTLFLVLLGIGYFALIFTNAFASALEPIYRVLSPTPIDWFGDLAALGLGVGASPFRAIGAVGFTGVFVVVAVVSLYRLSEWLWYADGVHITHEVERSDDRSFAVQRALTNSFTASLRCRRSRLETCPPVADLVVVRVVSPDRPRRPDCHGRPNRGDRNWAAVVGFTHWNVGCRVVVRA